VDEKDTSNTTVELITGNNVGLSVAPEVELLVLTWCGRTVGLVRCTPVEVKLDHWIVDWLGWV